MLDQNYGGCYSKIVPPSLMVCSINPGLTVVAIGCATEAGTPSTAPFRWCHPGGTQQR